MMSVITNNKRPCDSELPPAKRRQLEDFRNRLKEESLPDTLQVLETRDIAIELERNQLIKHQQHHLQQKPCSKSMEIDRNSLDDKRREAMDVQVNLMQIVDSMRDVSISREKTRISIERAHKVCKHIVETRELVMHERFQKILQERLDS